MNTNVVINISGIGIYIRQTLKIPKNLVSIMQTGNVLPFLRNDIKYKKKHIYEYYKDMIENGILKDTVKYNKDKNEFEIDSSFDEKYVNCKKEIMQIIISSLTNMMQTNPKEVPSLKEITWKDNPYLNDLIDPSPVDLLE